MASEFKPQKDYSKRMLEAGYVQVTSWIPVNDKQKLADFTAMLRDTDRVKKEAFKRAEIKKTMANIKKSLTN